MANYLPLTGVRIDEIIKSKLSTIAKLEKRSFNMQAALVFEQFIQQYEATHGVIVIEEQD